MKIAALVDDLFFSSKISVSQTVGFAPGVTFLRWPAIRIARTCGLARESANRRFPQVLERPPAGCKGSDSRLYRGAGPRPAKKCRQRHRGLANKQESPTAWWQSYRRKHPCLSARQQRERQPLAGPCLAGGGSDYPGACTS